MVCIGVCMCGVYRCVHVWCVCVVCVCVCVVCVPEAVMYMLQVCVHGTGVRW